MSLPYFTYLANEDDDFICGALTVLLSFQIGEVNLASNTLRISSEKDKRGGRRGCFATHKYVYVHQTIVYSKNQLEKKRDTCKKKEKPKSKSAQSKKHKSKITAGYPLIFSNAEPHVQLALCLLGYLPFSDAP